MIATRLWQDIGAGETFFTKLLRLAFLALSVAVFYFLASLPLTWPQQAVCGLLTLLVGLAVARSSDSYLITLTLMIMSMFCTFRYGFWRINTTVQFFSDPASHWGALDAFFIVSLLMAEAYSFMILVLGYFQCIWPLRRAPVALPDEESEWPHVDVLIPTYNEPLDVVRFTALGALNIDWPADKLHIYLLDDGRRKDFEEFAFEAGIGYRIRADNKHAKAGNINTALKSITSPFVAIFDCDHVPTRSFLQMTMGWFLRDRKLAMMQTPHHFYSPDPFERNLQQFRIIPNEGELFYGIVQDGNDFWNATFFCGSCAVLRRTALDEIGGIAVETVTEDAHTSLRMHTKGWNTAYINIPQAAGLATERLSAHVGQRIRWARGMIQILRTDNPLFAPGLKFPQRLCYFNAMCHFLYAIPRLIFLSAPLIYLILSHTNVPGYWAAILAYALPHLILSNVTNSRIQGDHRHSFWNEIYETVLSPYILLPTIMALINPKLGKFNVTAKGGIVKRTFFDTRIAQPFLILLIFNIAGIMISLPRYFLWDRDRPGTVIMNVIWCGFNVVILGVCTAVAREMRQLRNAVRIAMVTPVIAVVDDDIAISGETIDMSSSGTSIRLGEAYAIVPGTDLRLAFPLPTGTSELRSRVVSVEGTLLRVKFEDLTISEQEVLTMVLYSRADSWLGWGEAREPDNVLRSLGRIFHISMHGLVMTAHSLFSFPAKKTKKRPGIAATAALFLLGAFLFGTAPHARAQAAVNSLGEQAGAELPTYAPPPPGQFRDVFSLQDAGQSRIEMHGIDTNHIIFFTLPQTHVPRTARIHVVYSFSPSLLPQISHLKLLINGTLFATIEPTPSGTGGSSSQIGSADFNIPTELMVHNNQLTVQFIGHYVMVCEDPANTTLWARIERSSYLDVQGDQLPLADDLKELPLPFLDPAIVLPLSLPVIFPSTPSMSSIQAAGIVSSYFGVISEGRPVRFPVHMGDIPAGNAVMVSDDPSTFPASFNLANITLPTVAVRTNPNDPYSKVLVIAGKGADQVIQAAQAIALRTDLLTGPEATISKLVLPPKQTPDAAPRWARTDQTISLWDYSTADTLQGDGSAPLNVYFRLPPDIYFANRPDAILHLVYRYNSIPIGPISSMQIRVNNAFLGSLPLIPGQEASRTTKMDVPIPVVNLRPFSNSLSFEFTFQVMKKSGCSDTTPINMMGAILRDSFIDLRGYPHYVAMPNVELFANSGFPFTRYADLNTTTVVLPKEPTAQEIEIFVTLMGHFGRQTGLPTLRVAVAGPDALVKGADSDFLVLGIGTDQPGFDQLADYMPVSLPDGKIQVHDTQGFFAPIHRAWWKMRADEHTESGDLLASGAPDAIIEGIESPFAASGTRSIVTIRLKNAAIFEPFIHTFLFVQQASDIQGSVALLIGNRFQSFRIGANVYHTGYLPWWTRLSIWFMAVPWLVAVFLLFFAFLLAIWIREWLRQKARARLKMLD